MNKYVITFKRLKLICKHKNAGVYKKLIKTSHACTRKLNMEWVTSEDPAKFIECRESSCPILAKCDKVTT